MSTVITSDQVQHTVTHAWVGTANASQSVEYVDGVETRRNLLSNPSFETNTTGYNVATSSTAMTRDTTRGYSGAASLKLTSVSGQLLYAYLQPAPVLVPGDSYTLSYWAKIDTDLTAAIGVQVVFYDSAGTTVGNVLIPTALRYVTDWTQMSVSFVVPQGTVTTSVFLVRGVANSAAADTVWIDAVVLESGAEAMPYFDGSTPPFPIYGQSTPLLIDGWEESVDTRNIVNTIIGGGIDITPYPAGLRTGQYTAVFQNEDDAAALVQMHQQAARFTIQDDDRPSIAMTYIPNGTITRSLDDDSREFWTVTIPFQEVDA